MLNSPKKAIMCVPFAEEIEGGNRMTLRRFLLVTVAFVVMGASAGFGQSVDDLTLYTEEYPPFNFEERGALRGISVDLMDEMLSRAGSRLSKDDIQLVPWSQGYDRAQNRANTAVFATTRTPSREDLFKWVGPIAPTRVVVTGPADADINIGDLDDVQRYTVGTVRDDVGEMLLLEEGVSRETLEPVASPEPNARKLAAGRIDLWAYEENVAKWILSEVGENPGDYETYYVLDEGELHFAFNPDTPDSVLEQLQEALDSMREDGTYQQILSSYLE